MSDEPLAYRCKWGDCEAAFTAATPEIAEQRMRHHLGNHAASSGDPDNHPLAGFLPAPEDDYAEGDALIVMQAQRDAAQVGLTVWRDRAQRRGATIDLLREQNSDLHRRLLAAEDERDRLRSLASSASSPSALAEIPSTTGDKE